MQNRTPVPRAARPALPTFTPVPRLKYRHDGWTPERQVAFIEALADTGSVTRAAGLVNMAQANCYTLRRAPGAEEFRRAWDAALDFGVQRLKDIAFERAIEGELIPVFAAGKLMGFRRKTNDRLLMFCLRHYGQDAGGKRTTINYFSARASAGGDGAAAEAVAGTATVGTVIQSHGAPDAVPALRDDRVAGELNGFSGVALDDEAAATISAALEACAVRQREAEAAIELGGEAAADAVADDPAEAFVRLPHMGDEYRGSLIPPVEVEEFVPFREGEAHWSMAGAALPEALAAAAPVAEVKRPKAENNWKAKAG